MHFRDTACLLVERYLAVGPRPLSALYEITQVVNFFPTAQIIEHVINHVEHLLNGLADGKPHPPYKINDVGVQARAHDPPFVFIDQVARKHGQEVLALVEPADFGDQSLTERGKSQGIIESGWHIEDAK